MCAGQVRVSRHTMVYFIQSVMPQLTESQKQEAENIIRLYQKDTVLEAGLPEERPSMEMNIVQHEKVPESGGRWVTIDLSSKENVTKINEWERLLDQDPDMG